VARAHSYPGIQGFNSRGIGGRPKTIPFEIQVGCTRRDRGEKSLEMRVGVDAEVVMLSGWQCQETRENEGLDEAFLMRHNNAGWFMLLRLQAHV
jgi:hypothetical protein